MKWIAFFRKYQTLQLTLKKYFRQLYSYLCFRWENYYVDFGLTIIFDIAYNCNYYC